MSASQHPYIKDTSQYRQCDMELKTCVSVRTA